MFFPASTKDNGVLVQAIDELGAKAHAGPLNAIERAIYRGPNLHSLRPMVRIRLELGALEGRPSNTLPNFSRRLLKLLPGLGGHHCSKG